MKWTYKDCDIEIIVTADELPRLYLKPIVEIGRKDAGLQTVLKTDHSFRSIERAEQYGMEMARQWIDEHL